MTSIETARSLANKLQEFSETLNEEEQEALSNLMLTANRAFSAAAVVPFSGDVAPEITQLNELLETAHAELKVGEEVAITPTTTTITITTTVASHPVIGC